MSDVVIDRGTMALDADVYRIELGRQAAATFAGWISETAGRFRRSYWPLRLAPGVVMGANDS